MALVHIEQQPKVARRDIIRTRERDDRVLRVGSLDVDRVRGRIDVFDVADRLEHDLDLGLVDGVRRVPRRAQWEDEVGQAVILPQQLVVVQHDLSLGTGWHRKNARLEQTPAHPLEQRRIFIRPNDRLIL